MYSDVQFVTGCGSLRARKLRILVIIFTILVAIVLLNLLVAQLNMAYKLAHSDMEGYARLTRAGIIVTTVEQVSRKRWRNFLQRLGMVPSQALPAFQCCRALPSESGMAMEGYQMFHCSHPGKVRARVFSFLLNGHMSA